MCFDYPNEAEILKLQKEGHTFHCAIRLINGDGECECNLKGIIPGAISNGMYLGVCNICLKPSPAHELWCKCAKQ